MMKTLSISRILTFLFLLTSLSGVFGQEINRQGSSANLNHGKLTVDKNGHFLCFEDGSPFFFMGDTAWDLFYKLKTNEAEQYFENRRQKGFTVIQVVVIPENDGLNAPNAYGEVPLVNGDPLTPNETYFSQVDYTIRLAEKKGIFIGMLPTWGDKVDKQWGTGPVIFNKDNAYRYGKWIGTRYKDFKNIIWIIGGDRDADGGNFEIWDAMAKGIKSADANHLMTFHPRGWASSSKWFQQSEWLDFNMLQSSHFEQYIANYKLIEADYKLTPAKPTLDAEFCYEEHPINWSNNNGWYDDVDVRRAAYWNFFSGACGLTYGSISIIQFYESTENDMRPYKISDWHKAMDLPGAWDMGHLRNLVESRDLLSLAPDTSIIINQSPLKINHMVAIKGNCFAMVYAPASELVTVQLGKFEADTIVAWWFNPRSGESDKIGEYLNSGQQSYKVPVKYIDWVLVLDDKNKNFMPPGKL